MAKFKEVIECLKSGGTAYRPGWNGYGDMEIMMQIPQRIAKDIVPKMTSVQDKVKKAISASGSGEIEYHHQVLMIDFPLEPGSPTRATYYIPTWEDIMAEDWIIMQGEFSYLDSLVTERDELTSRSESILSYLGTKAFFDRPKNMQNALIRRYDIMKEYINILDEMIKIESTANG